jgi:hypothetical protein
VARDTWTTDNRKRLQCAPQGNTPLQLGQRILHGIPFFSQQPSFFIALCCISWAQFGAHHQFSRGTMVPHDCAWCTMHNALKWSTCGARLSGHA